MKYTIVVGHSEDSKAFEDVVQEFVDKGWQPLGGVSVTYLGDYGENSIYQGSPILRFDQAMFRSE